METDKMKNDRGFTLIEIMGVVAIIGILTAVVLPSYWNSVMKSRRSSAQSALLDLASREARYYTSNNVYTADLPTLGFPTGTTAVPVPGGGNNHFYDVTATVGPDPNSYTLTAVPVGAQTKDSTCYTYTYSNLGLRANQDASGTALTSCWN
jgi:type IV pilus assembly protein PilE